MAFKMNGSPVKLGTIQGTAGHASALKQGKPVPLPSPGGKGTKDDMKIKSKGNKAIKLPSPAKQYKKPVGPRAKKKYNSGETTSKSDADLFIARSTEVKNPRTGENLLTEYMESGPENKSYRIPVTKGKEKKNMGLYTVKDSETGKEVPVDPRDQSIAPSNVVKGVEPGRSYQMAFEKYNKSRKTSK